MNVLNKAAGAYILSPLEEASRDPAQNAGFVVTWHNMNQTTRVSSYSVRNTLSETAPVAAPVTGASGTTTTPPAKAIPAGGINTAAVALPFQRLGQSLTRGAGRARDTLLSNILSNAALAAQAETTFAAFKVLPIDPARVRMASSTSSASTLGGAPGDGAPSCRIHRGSRRVERRDELPRGGRDHCRLYKKSVRGCGGWSWRFCRGRRCG
jgi:hypothetical protein